MKMWLLLGSRYINFLRLIPIAIGLNVFSVIGFPDRETLGYENVGEIGMKLKVSRSAQIDRGTGMVLILMLCVPGIIFGALMTGYEGRWKMLRDARLEVTIFLASG